MTTGAQDLYAALCEGYPDFERRVPRELARLPWLELFTYRTLPKDTLRRLDQASDARGLTPVTRPHDPVWRTLFIEEMQRHQASVVASVGPAVVRAIIDWFIEHDTLYPDLVRRQTDYWHRPETQRFHANGRFTVDLRQIDFWDISDGFYMEKERLLPVALMPEFLIKQIHEGIAQHYLDRALYESSEAP